MIVYSQHNMSWYTSRRQYFNRITNDSANNIRFFTKPTGAAHPQPSATESTAAPKKAARRAKTKAAPTTDKDHSSTTLRTKSSGETTKAAATSTGSKRKVTFADREKKPKPVAKKERQDKKQLKPAVVTPDNFI